MPYCLGDLEGEGLNEFLVHSVNIEDWGQVGVGKHGRRESRKKTEYHLHQICSDPSQDLI